MQPSSLNLDSLPPFGTSEIISGSSVCLKLLQSPTKFFRHGWQSWALTTWLDPRTPPIPIRAPEFRMKDEDPAYALAENHVSAWVGAVELGEDDIVLVGALDLGGRVELDGSTLRAFQEEAASGRDHRPEWLLARSTEEAVFSTYTGLLEKRFGRRRAEKAPRVWCSWYSLYTWTNERLCLKALRDLAPLPFDVFQIDDGWQRAHGDWEANRKFPAGMPALAEQICLAGKTPGIWLAPFMVSPRSELAKQHPDWLLRDEDGTLIRAGITLSGNPYCLDSSHPRVLEWLDGLIRRVRAWGYGYLKLDFLYLGALIGKRYNAVPREAAYRNALRVMREAAGEAYILTCGAPILPSLGLCDGIRVGPDVAPFWLNRPLSVWLNNPNDTSTQNAIRTSLHRLWLRPLVDVDPDVAFFRTKFNALKPSERQLLQDLGTVSGFRATSDLPQWLRSSETEALRRFWAAAPEVRKLSRYKYRIDGRIADFASAVPLPTLQVNMPIWLARILGLLKIALYQVLPAIRASRRF